MEFHCSQTMSTHYLQWLRQPEVKPDSCRHCRLKATINETAFPLVSFIYLFIYLFFSPLIAASTSAISSYEEKGLVERNGQ